MCAGIWSSRGEVAQGSRKDVDNGQQGLDVEPVQDSVLTAWRP